MQSYCTPAYELSSQQTNKIDMSNQKLPYSSPELAELGDVQSMTGNFATNDYTDVNKGSSEQPNEGISA